MNREETIKLAEEWLKSVPNIKKDIRGIDAELKKDIYDIEDIEKLNYTRNRLHRKLTKIIKAVSTLNDEEQRIICYRYFDKFSYKIISLNVGYSLRTIARRLESSKLTIGRVMFGFEDEFWRTIDQYSIH